MPTCDVWSGAATPSGREIRSGPEFAPTSKTLLLPPPPFLPPLGVAALRSPLPPLDADAPTPAPSGDEVVEECDPDGTFKLTSVTNL